jgi:hypothetical protein
MFHPSALAPRGQTPLHGPVDLELGAAAMRGRGSGGGISYVAERLGHGLGSSFFLLIQYVSH